MNKSPYIGKYDFVNYFCEQPCFWFFGHDAILASIDLQYKIIEDEEDEEVSEDIEFDNYNYYRERKEYYGEIDKKDPKILEGLIIDEKTRKFITESYPGIMAVDLENDFPNLKNEALADMTKELLEKHKNIILFQPVFIAGHLITKPDVIIKDDLEITLIETKGTTTAKLYHVLDVYFQSRVLTRIDFLEDYAFNYNLCLVKYCLAAKKTVPLIITPNVNLSKSLSLGKVPKSERGLVKTGTYAFSTANDGLVEVPIDLTNLCEHNLVDVENRKETLSNGASGRSLDEKTAMLNDVYENFDNIAEKLWTRKMELNKELDPTIKNIAPHRNDKPAWKTSDIFPALRKLYVKQGYELFKYSGTVTDQRANVLEHITTNDAISQYFKKSSYAEEFLPHTDSVRINHATYNKLLNQLKNKKVYFDFETINTSIRPIDNCYPFSQIVTQCSIIIDDNTNPNIGDLECNNVLIDPLHISNDNFKEIVDSLYRGEDYSYIVFNATFERGRLQEFKDYLNDPEYSIKIDVIINNLFDLALFFRVSDGKTPILIQELYGFYSIKKILAYISKCYPKLFEITKCKDYLSLPVSNGSICQNKTMMRFYDILDDKEWQELSNNLKIYCENDVRAMIAVELLVKTLKSN